MHRKKSIRIIIVIIKLDLKKESMVIYHIKQVQSLEYQKLRIKL